MPMVAFPPPSLDPELGAVLALLPEMLTAPLTEENLAAKRDLLAVPPVAELLVGRAVVHTERVVPGPDGAPDVILSIFTKEDHAPGGPALYHTHGGGMVLGNRFAGVVQFLDWVESMDLVLVSVEYRLAPEHPDPAPVDDCYAGLVWTSSHAGELGFDPARLVVAGGSAGGGLAAAMALMARDRDGPLLAGQLLIYPMIDDRNDTFSSRQMDGIGVWNRASNESGWSALLGERRRTDRVSIYAAPARATDLSALPPAYIEVGSAEVFRDECVAYAGRIWAAGGAAELHVWPGAFHGFDILAPDAALSHQATQARALWIRRLVGVKLRASAPPDRPGPAETVADA